jgi:hypothetical protein
MSETGQFREKYGQWAVIAGASEGVAARIWPGDRRAAVEAMSAATRAFAQHRVGNG